MLNKNLYKYVRKSLPPELRGQLTKLLYAAGVKPSVSPQKSPFDLGKLLISADFEMAWAFRFSKNLSNMANEQGLLERSNIPLLIRQLENYNIPITWAIVGHLYLDKCLRMNDVAHPEMIKPAHFKNRNWQFSQGDWYNHDPCTNYIQDPAWYAPDLIKFILDSTVRHEIGCHTFSHIDFTYSNCTPELAESEINACIKLAAQNNLTLRSMVFPGGTAGNFEILANKGFICYRKPMKYNIDIPYIDQFGLVAIPSSWGLEKAPYKWQPASYFKMAEMYYEVACKNKMICHFWFHPSMSPWYLNNILPAILEMATRYRDKGDLEILTMHQLAEEVLINDTISS